MKNEEFATALSSPLRGGVRGGLLLLCILLAACGSRKHAVKTSTEVQEQTTTVASPSADASQPAQAKPQEEACVTARLRLDLSSGGKGTSVGGSLRMKHGDVIQLSVVTFGILEVARIEATPDYFMVIDKMGRQYVRAAYADVPFLKNANIDFNTLQTYFWDEQTSSHAAWERRDFVSIGARKLPTRHIITVRGGSKPVKADLTLSNLRSDDEWEKRTQIPSNYKEVTVDEAMTRIMNLGL